jgi:hypothetical protein
MIYENSEILCTKFISFTEDFVMSVKNRWKPKW